MRSPTDAGAGDAVRLLLAIPYFAPAYAFGGSVTVAETVVADALAAGHEVTVVTTDVLDEHQRLAPGTPATPAGAVVVRFPNVSHRLAAGVNGYLPRGYRSWVRRNARRFDVVLLHDVYSAVSVGAARAAVAAGVPYALQPLGTLSPAAERGRPLAKRAFLTLFGRRTLAQATALIHSTDAERRDFLDVGADAAKLVRLPLPLELPELTGAPLESAPTVAYVGRLHEIKRIDNLIRAVGDRARAAARRAAGDRRAGGAPPARPGGARRAARRRRRGGVPRLRCGRGEVPRARDRPRVRAAVALGGPADGRARGDGDRHAGRALRGLPPAGDRRRGRARRAGRAGRHRGRAAGAADRRRAPPRARRGRPGVRARLPPGGRDAADAGAAGRARRRGRV